MCPIFKYAWVTLLGGALLLSGCATGSKPPSPVQSGFKAVSPQVANAQTRHLHRVSEEAVLAAAGAVLQELGYAAGTSEASLGVIAAAKEDIHRVPLKQGLINYAGMAVGFGLAAAVAPVAAGIGLAGLTVEALKPVKPDDTGRRARKVINDYPCVDRLVLTTTRGGTEGKCCIVRVVVQRAFPEPGTDRYANGWVVTDAAVYQDFFNRLAARLAAPAT